MLFHSLQAMSGSLLLECSAVLRQQGFLDPSAKLLDEHQALAGQHSEVNKEARLRLLLSQASWVPSTCFSGVGCHTVSHAGHLLHAAADHTAW